MFLAVDIGNSKIKCGLYKQTELLLTFEMESSTKASVAAYRHSLRTRLADQAPTSAAISSVVPELTELIGRAVRDDFMILPSIIHAELELPFAVDYQPVGSLGADRICAAAAAFDRFGTDNGSTRAIIVVDAGTAVTYDVIEAGCYRGGAIAPGPDLSRSSLVGGTAQLDDVKLALPESPLAHNTADGIRSGILFGLLDSVAAMINRLSLTCDSTPYVVSTGGWGALLANHVEQVDIFEPHLVLEGIRFLAESQA